MTESGAGAPRRVSSLRELPQAIEPPRDLWPQIEAGCAAGDAGAARASGPPVRRGRTVPLRWLAAAAMVGCVAVGVWIGRSVAPRVGPTPPPVAVVSTPPAAGGAVPAAWVIDPRYQRQHQALMQSLQAQLATLPPPTRAKVLASLATIRAAKQDLEEALGRDPGNALLQGLLVDTYQDEMRVLTDVQQASDTGKGI
jgi:hypothetical protein